MKIIRGLRECDPHEANLNVSKIYRTYGRRFVEDIHMTLSNMIKNRIAMLESNKGKLTYRVFAKSKLKLFVEISAMEDEIIAYGKLRHTIRTILQSNGTPMLADLVI